MNLPEPDPAAIEKIRQCVALIKHSPLTDEEIAQQIYTIVSTDDESMPGQPIEGVPI